MDNLAAQIEAAFHTQIKDYSTSNGTTFFANSSNPLLPATLSGNVVGVLGLTNAVAARSHYACFEAQSPASNGDQHCRAGDDERAILPRRGQSGEAKRHRQRSRDTEPEQRSGRETEELLGARPCAGKCRRAERQPAEDRTDREDHRRSKRATAPCDATTEEPRAGYR